MKRSLGVRGPLTIACPWIGELSPGEYALFRQELVTVLRKWSRMAGWKIDPGWLHLPIQHEPQSTKN